MALPPKTALTTATAAAQDRAALQSMVDIGFIDLDQHIAVPRIFAMTTAPEKRGKTHFACTLPGPIAVISWDTGTKPVMDRVAKKELGKKVWVNSMVNAKGLSATDGAKEWQKVIDMCSAIITAPPTAVRSLFIDTGTAMWEMCRLAMLGKLTQVKSHHYGVANNAFEGVFQALYSRSDLNVIVAHKSGKKYVNDSWDGKSLEPKCYSGMPFIVDLVIDHYIREETDGTITYGLAVNESREEMARVKGLRLESNLTRSDEIGPAGAEGPVDECNIQTLGTVIYGAETAGVWQ